WFPPLDPDQLELAPRWARRRLEKSTLINAASRLEPTCDRKTPRCSNDGNGLQCQRPKGTMGSRRAPASAEQRELRRRCYKRGVTRGRDRPPARARKEGLRVGRDAPDGPIRARPSRAHRGGAARHRAWRGGDRGRTGDAAL